MAKKAMERGAWGGGYVYGMLSNVGFVCRGSYLIKYFIAMTIKKTIL
jgi:hypothetical protein